MDLIDGGDDGQHDQLKDTGSDNGNRLQQLRMMSWRCVEGC